MVIRKENEVMNQSNILFDKDGKSFQILCGSKGIYKYSDIIKCQIVFEQSKYHNEEKPFPIEHRVLITRYNFSWINRTAYVGVEFQMKNNSKIYVYISNKKRVYNSDDFQKDVIEAKVIKEKIDKRITKTL